MATNNLVDGLEHGLYFSIVYGNVIIPTDFHIFQRVETTNQGMFGRDAINRDLFDAGKFDKDRFGRDKFDGAKFDRDYR